MCIEERNDHSLLGLPVAGRHHFCMIRPNLARLAMSPSERPCLFATFDSNATQLAAKHEDPRRTLRDGL